MTEKYGSGRFCCKSCANSHIKHGKYTKELLQNKSKRKTHREAYAEYLENPPKCLICGEILTYE